MKVAVIGGTGVLGRLVVARLAAGGDEVRVVSRHPPAGGAASLGARVEHHRADVRGGEGLAAALDGVETVVDAVNASRAARAVLVEGGRTLLAAEAAAGVGHHVAISIVGCDRVSIGYYRTKVAQEEVVAAGPIPWTLLRATQFHQLVEGLFAAAGRARLLPRGGVRVQPIDPSVVAARLAAAVHAGPGGRLPDVGGPEVRTLTELAGDWRAHGGRRALPLPLPLPGKLGRALRGGALCDPAAALPGVTFAQWLAREGADVPESVAR